VTSYELDDDCGSTIKGNKFLDNLEPTGLSRNTASQMWSVLVFNRKSRSYGIRR